MYLDHPEIGKYQKAQQYVQSAADSQIPFEKGLAFIVKKFKFNGHLWKQNQKKTFDVSQPADNSDNNGRTHIPVIMG